MRTAPAVLALLLFAVLAAPVRGQAPQTVSLGAGAIVGPQDVDLSPQVSVAGLPVGGSSLCAIDDDGSGTYTPGELVYLDVDDPACSTNSESMDIRLVPGDVKPAGSVLRPGDRDHGQAPLAPLPDALGFFDANGDGAFGLGDALYVDVMAPGGLTINVGDLRLTAWADHPALRPVAANDSDLNHALVALGGGALLSTPFILGYYDIDGDAAYSPADVMYVNPDGPVVIPLLGADVPVTGDVRLNPFGPYPAGTIVGPVDLDTVGPYRVPGLPGAIAGNLCFIDDDGSGTYQAGEALLFDVDAACTTKVEASDLRLTAGAGQPAGSLVRSGHADFNSPVLPVAPALGDNLRFFDANGDAAFNAGDALYIDIMAPASLRVQVGDLRLSSWGALPALSAVWLGDSDINNALGEIGAGLLSSTPNVLAYLDAQNDAVFNTGDLPYINADAGAFPEFVQPNDVRLAAVPPFYLAGSLAGPTDLDVTPLLGLAGLAPSVCGIDDDGSGAHEAGEPVLVDVDDAACSTNVEANDLRLTGDDALPGGTKVLTRDADFNSPVIGPLNDDLRFFDADGDGAFGFPDTLYLDLMNAAASAAGVGDLRLTPYGTFPAFSAVRAGDDDLNLGLLEFPAAQGGARDLADAGAMLYYDIDSTGALSLPDAYYLNLDLVAVAGQVVAIGDVRLTSLEAVVLLPDIPPGQEPPQGQRPMAPAGNISASLRQQLEELADQNALLGIQLNQSLTRNVQLSQQVSNLSGQLGEQSRQLTALASQLQAVQGENAQLRQSLADGSRATPSFGPLLAAAALGAAVALAQRRRP